MSGPLENEDDKEKYARDYREGQEIAEADLEGDGPNTSLIGGLVGKVRDIIDPSEGREDGYQERVEEVQNHDETAPVEQERSPVSVP